MVASIALALVLFASLAATALAMTRATARPVLQDDELFVELAAPPEPEPEPEPELAPPEPIPHPAPRPGPRVVREEVDVPDEVPDEDLAESDADLVEGGESGPVTGSTRGGGTGRGTVEVREPARELEPPRPPPHPPGPIQLPENGIPAQRLGEPPPLDYPDDARSAGVQGLVLVRCAIDLEGVPERCQVLRGPSELRAAALAWAERNRFTPARLEDGTAVVTWKVLPVVFRLTNI